MNKDVMSLIEKYMNEGYLFNLKGISFVDNQFFLKLEDALKYARSVLSTDRFFNDLEIECKEGVIAALEAGHKSRILAHGTTYTFTIQKLKIR